MSILGKRQVEGPTDSAIPFSPFLGPAQCERLHFRDHIHAEDREGGRVIPRKGLESWVFTLPPT